VTTSSGIDEALIRTVGPDCGSLNEYRATLDASGNTVVVEGTLPAPTPCHDAVLESVELLTDTSERFAEKFVAKLEADREGAAAQVEQSMALATALAPTIGYDEAATIAKTALEEGKTIREVAVEGGYLTAERAEELLDPSRMTERGLLE